MSITPVQFATSIFYLNGAPLKLPEHSMRHLYPIYNKPSQSVLLKFGRQTHKSSTVGYKISLPCIRYRNYHSLYVAPTGNQVSVFSTDKLNGALHESTLIKDQYFNTQTKDQIGYREFANGSKIYLRSAFHTADSIRGISADQNCIDEIQDIISDHIPVIEQCMSHSLAKWDDLKERYPDIPMHLFNNRLYAGTPKTIENTMERYWVNSTQNEWIILCKHCNKFNYINENNIGQTCLVCNKCGKPIFYEDGNWISMNPSGFIEGYRLPQVVLNWINNIKNPQAWQINVINTRKIYSTEKFYNEVLALPYANAKHPINIMELKACCRDYGFIGEDQAFNNKLLFGIPTFAGIDWGKGDTASGTSYSVIFIAAWLQGRFRIIYAKKYVGKMSDPLLQVEDMLRLINLYACSLTIADTGDGRTSNAMCAKALGAGRFGEIFEHGTLKQKIKWDRFKGHYLMNRTRMMTDVMMEIKRGEIDLPNFETFEPHVHDFTGIYSEYSDRTRLTKYDHNVPDDSFHSYMFCRIACAIFRGEFSRYLQRGMNETDVGDEPSESIG